jgi:hypothetical protein
MQRVGVLRHKPQDFAVAAFGLAQPPCAVMLQSDLERFGDRWYGG